MKSISNSLGAWILAIVILIPMTSVYGAPLAVEGILNTLEMDEDDIGKLGNGSPVLFDLSEGRDDELAAGIAWYLAIPVASVSRHLKSNNPDLLDIGVSAHGLLSQQSSVNALSGVFLSKQEVGDLLDAKPGSQLNLSNGELESIKHLKNLLSGKSAKAIHKVVEQRYREIIFKRFEDYRQGGTAAIAPYARENNQHSAPSIELRQAASENSALLHYLPNFFLTWLDYPKNLQSGVEEHFRWVKKDVEGRMALILRHQLHFNWNQGMLVLTREFYAEHSYNASQWLTGCLPYRNGTVVFQQVRSFTDQVSGFPSHVKHVVGRKLLKYKMLKAFERLCDNLEQCQ